MFFFLFVFWEGEEGVVVLFFLLLILLGLFWGFFDHMERKLF